MEHIQAMRSLPGVIYQLPLTAGDRRCWCTVTARGAVSGLSGVRAADDIRRTEIEPSSAQTLPPCAALRLDRRGVSRPAVSIYDQCHFKAISLLRK